MRLLIMAGVLSFTVLNLATADEPSARYRLSSQGQEVLGQFGLDAIQPVTVQEAQQVRGTGGSAGTRGHSFLSAMVMDPQSKSYAFGVDTNMGFANVTQGGIVGPVDPFHVQKSSLGIGLNVENFFNGFIIGTAGGSATAYYR